MAMFPKLDIRRIIQPWLCKACIIYNNAEPLVCERCHLVKSGQAILDNVIELQTLVLLSRGHCQYWRKGLVKQFG